MQKSPSLDQYKIPAFQRKRSLAAKARRKRVPATALEKVEAGIPFVKPKRRVAVRRRVSRSMDEGLYGSASRSLERDGYSSPLVEDESGFSSPLLPEGPLYTEEPTYSREPSYAAEPSLKKMRPCGKIEGYIEKIEVAIVKVSASIRTGDRLIFESSEGGLFEQTLSSMQIDRKDVMTAYSGDDVGMKVLAEPKKGGNVYKVIDYVID